MAATIFSTQLQKLRKAKGIRQEQLAQHLGVSTQAVSKWENGSYPDGDLLPKIAKFFDVSIDYLYGDEKETMRFDERIMEYLDKKEGTTKRSRMDKMLEIQWMSMGMGTNIEEYFAMPKIEKTEEVTGSCIMTEDGFSYLRIREDLKYGFTVERPKEGYEAYVSDTQKLAEVFQLFGSEDALRILLLMMTLKRTECVRVSTVAKYLNLPVQTVEKVLEKALSFDSDGLVLRSSLLKEDGTEEKLYRIQYYTVVVILRLFIVAKDILYPMHSYRGLWDNMTMPLLDREKLIELWKKQTKITKKEGEESNE